MRPRLHVAALRGIRGEEQGASAPRHDEKHGDVGRSCDLHRHALWKSFTFLWGDLRREVRVFAELPRLRRSATEERSCDEHGCYSLNAHRILEHLERRPVKSASP